jgi:hypothetical protein
VIKDALGKQRSRIAAIARGATCATCSPSSTGPRILARIRGAWVLTDTDLAKQCLEQLACELDRTWPDAAGSLRGGWTAG